MTRVVTMASGFLLAVLWFDLMFDVQAKPYASGEIPANVRQSISAYYARVTTGASPRSKLIVVVMLSALAGIVAEMVTRTLPLWRTVPSLLMALVAIGLAKQRTVPTAVRIGMNTDDAGTQSHLIRRVYADHRISFVLMVCVLTLHLLP